MKSYVYWIMIKDTEFHKIGYSTDPQKRMAKLQTSSPSKFKLMRTIPGDRRLEKALHAELAEFWLKGEWFCTSAYRVARAFDEVAQPVPDGQLMLTFGEDVLDPTPAPMDTMVIEMPAESNHVILVQAGKKAA